MKNIAILLTSLSLSVCMGQNSNDDYFLFNLSNETIIAVSPDSLAIEDLKIELGEKDFYTAVDDVAFYESRMINKLDSLNIPLIRTEARRIRVITPNDQIEIDANLSMSKWRYFHFNGKELQEKDIFDIIDM